MSERIDVRDARLEIGERNNLAKKDPKLTASPHAQLQTYLQQLSADEIPTGP